MSALTTGPSGRAATTGANTAASGVICSGNPAPALDGGEPAYDAFVSKPVDLGTLLDTLQRLGIAPSRMPEAAADGGR